MQIGVFLLIAPLALPVAALAQPAAQQAAPAAPAMQDQPVPPAAGADTAALVPDPAAEGLRPAAEPPPVGIRLGWPGMLAAKPPAPSPAATVVQAGSRASPAAATPSGLQVNAGIGFAAPHAVTGQVGVLADLIGGGPDSQPAQVTGTDPYSVPTAPRTADRTVGVGASYTVPTGNGASVRISGSVGVASYAPDEPVRQPLGMTSIKIDF